MGIAGLVAFALTWDPGTQSPGTAAVARAAQKPDKARLTGRYRREDYGFAIDIPGDVIAFGPACNSEGICGSTHGFSGTLLKDRGAEIYLFPEFSPAVGNPPQLARSNSELLHYVLSGSHPDGAQLAAVVRSSEGSLDTIAASRIVAKFKDSASKAEWTVDVIYGLRMVSPNETILYRIGMSTSSRKYESDKGTLERLIKAFRIIPIA